MPEDLLDIEKLTQLRLISKVLTVSSWFGEEIIISREQGLFFIKYDLKQSLNMLI